MRGLKVVRVFWWHLDSFDSFTCPVQHEDKGALDGQLTSDNDGHVCVSISFTTMWHNNGGQVVAPRADVRPDYVIFLDSLVVMEWNDGRIFPSMIK